MHSAVDNGINWECHQDSECYNVRYCLTASELLTDSPNGCAEYCLAPAVILCSASVFHTCVSALWLSPLVSLVLPATY